MLFYFLFFLSYVTYFSIVCVLLLHLTYNFSVWISYRKHINFFYYIKLSTRESGPSPCEGHIFWVKNNIFRVNGFERFRLKEYFCIPKHYSSGNSQDLRHASIDN